MNILYALRRNHVSVAEIRQVKGDFYNEYLQFRQMAKQLSDWRQSLHKRLSALIDSDSSRRIAYIYLQKMLSEEKNGLERIPKADQLDSDLLNEILQYHHFQESVHKSNLALDANFMLETERGDHTLRQIYEQNWHVQNALLTTNSPMFRSLKNPATRKKKTKLWKVMMRAFAKTAPLSTYTSLSLFDQRDDSMRLEINQCVLLKLLDLFLLIPEVMRNSNFLVDYELANEGIQTRSRYGKLQVAKLFYGNENSVYTVPKQLGDLFPCGDVLSSEQIMAAGGIWMTTEMLRKLQLLGFFKNTVQVECPEPNLRQLIGIAERYTGKSLRIEEFVNHLKSAQEICSHLEKCFDLHHKERDLCDLRHHLECCAALCDGRDQLHDFEPVAESSYFCTEQSNPGITEGLEKYLRILAEFMPVFDNRLIFQHYVKNIVEQKGKIPFAEILSTFHTLVNEYQKFAVDQTLDRSFFCSDEVSRKLMNLRKNYHQVMMNCADGTNVLLPETLVDSIIEQLRRLPINSTAFTKFLIQHDKSGYFVINDLQFSYLNFFIRHGMPSQNEQLFRLLKQKLQCDGSPVRLITYSPSYGYHPNLSMLQGEVKWRHPSGLRLDFFQHPSFFGHCTLSWDREYLRFQLEYGDQKIIPLYTGQLAPSHLSEHMTVLPYLFQNGFAQGIQVHYLSISLRDYTELGRITFGPLVLQRKRQILHSKLLENIGPEFQGYAKFHELLEHYHIPAQTFVRLFPVVDGKLQIRYGDVGLHKPIFFDAEEPVYYSHMLRHIYANMRKYGELAVVFEEAMPNPYENETVVQEHLYEIG